MLAEQFGAPTDAVIETGFHCDYGSNIQLGKAVYFNFDCVILDCAAVTTGAAVKFGLGVRICTAHYPLAAAERRRIEAASPIPIGENAWIGGAAVILPGVSVGANAVVVGAGSVILKDVPAVAVGKRVPRG